MKAISSLLKQLWRDECGFIVSAEMVLVGTIGVLSMVVGLAAVSNSVTNEMYDMADAFNSVNQNNNGYGNNGYGNYGGGRRGGNNRYSNAGADIVIR